MWERTPEEQAKGRYVLLVSAKMACDDGFSMQEWMENDDVLECVERYQLDVQLLEHIAWYVWYPIKR